MAAPMDGQPKRQWGVTNAISEAHPTPTDLKLNDKLVEALKAENNFETPEGADRRSNVLHHFQNVTEEFVRRVCKAKGKPASVVDSAGGKIFTFGSYALGVYNPGSDIDTLLVAPKHVGLEDFFEHFPNTFREMSDAADIAELNPVPSAYVPIIKMEFRGVSIDLLFVSLPSVSTVDRDMKLTDTSLLRGLDDTSMRSVNGTRVTSELLDSVPQVKAFRHATRAIKLWSNRRGIYGAVFGYPGGVAWAIMVARICQLYPFACGATILSKFFSLMQRWPWPRPVMLKTIEEGTMGLRVWNPSLYHQDRAHMMPIITPAFPSMCATHTIMPSTKTVMLNEFDRANNIINGIFDINSPRPWSDLFERHSFFTSDHKYYLSVIAASRTKDAHNSFSGLVQSKVRLLVKGLDDAQESGVSLARPYMKGVDRVHRYQTDEESDRIIQGNLDFQVQGEELTKAEESPNDGSDGGHTLYTSTFYIGLQLADQEPGGGNRKLDISFPAGEFKRVVMNADGYDEDLMSVRIVHTRNHDLPADVFQPGEVRPTKPIKEKKKKRSEGRGASKSTKRGIAEAGLDDQSAVASKKRVSMGTNGIVGTPTPA